MHLISTLKWLTAKYYQRNIPHLAYNGHVMSKNLATCQWNISNGRFLILNTLWYKLQHVYGNFHVYPSCLNAQFRGTQREILRKRPKNNKKA